MRPRPTIFSYVEAALPSSSSRVVTMPKRQTCAPSWEGADVLCEAKTINRSEREVVARTQKGVSSVSNRLPTEFFTKLTSTIRRADQQMAASSSAPDIKRIVYLVVNFDDSLHEYVDDYLAQIQQRREEFVVPGLEIVLEVKPKFYSATLASAAPRTLNFISAAPWLPPSFD
jgi:hypothetical protein